MATEDQNTPAIPLPPEGHAASEPKPDLFPASSIGVTPPEPAPVAPSAPSAAPIADAASSTPVAPPVPEASATAAPNPYAAPAAPNPYAAPAAAAPSAPYGAQPTDPYAQQAYGQQPYNPYATAQQGPTQGLSIAALICGAVGLLMSFFAWGFLPALAGVILGHIAQKRQPWAKGFWLTGMITGYVGILISVLWLVFIIVMFALSAAAGTGSYNY